MLLWMVTLRGVKELSGRVGTVVGFSGSGLIGVEFDLPFAQGHDCSGAGRRGHCRYGVAAQLEFADEGTLPEQIAFSYGDLMGI